MNQSRKLRLARSVCALAVITLLAHPASSPAVDTGWPRELDHPKAKITIYQPQLESFEGGRLTARAAVSVAPKPDQQPVFGAVWFEARAATDRDSRLVYLSELKVSHATFPNATPAKLAEFSEFVKQHMTEWNPVVSLDRILTALDSVEKRRTSQAMVKNDPPKIVFMDCPAVLLTIDGKPELRPIEKSSLMRVVNTPFVVILDPPSRTYYLRGDGAWLSAKDVAGPWESATSVPDAVAKTVREEGDRVVNSSAASAAKMPRIVVATEPTELFITDGPPKYTPLGDLDLLYVSNTDRDVFMQVSTQKTFVLISGRWFAAASTAGPWTFVPAKSLPSDFVRIPEDSDKADVLAHVPGTDESRDAINEMYVPQTSVIDRAKAALTVEYDGDPKFAPIDGTKMSHAVNSPDDVIRVGDMYYCCHEAVWYQAPAPTGPWTVCTAVPPEIYTIPPSSPVYPVTYVNVYESTPTEVYVGYTPGYVGEYECDDAIVYGTGWYYPAWLGRHYYARPRTYGFAARYNSVTGSWGYAVGAAGAHGWVAYGYHNGVFHQGAWAAGGFYGGAHGAWWGHGGYHPHPVPYAGATPNDRLGRGEWHGREQNIYNRAENRIRNSPRDDFARQAPRRDFAKDRPAQLPADRRPGGVGEATPRISSDLGRNNVFADRDGNVYRRSQTGWEQRSPQGWSRPQPYDNRRTQAPQRSYSSNRDLDRSYQSRSRGEYRSNRYQSSPGGGGRSFGGGGGRRGGGRR